MDSPVAIAIGSNLGNRSEAIGFAVGRLAPLVTDLVLSAIVETEPEGEGRHSQPRFLNAVVVGRTALPARELLTQLLEIEQAFGRRRPYPGAPRTLDLDLVLLGDEIIDEPGLRVPHPRFRERFFVLGPLAEVAADWKDPVTGRRVAELLRDLMLDETR